MQFLYPIGLLALAGLIIPLLIHLWNVKQGKTLKIGSIAFLGESSRASSKSFKIHDWILFILRCFLLILIILILTQPYIKKNLSKENVGGWILVNQTKFPQVYKENKKTIDSLVKSNYELHDFNIGFSKLELKDTNAVKNSNQSSTISHTSLLNQLNKILPAGSTVFLYADHRLINLDDNLPEIRYKLNWKPLNQTDTLSSWIYDHAGKKYEGNSNPKSTIYKTLNTEDAAPIKVAIHESSSVNDGKYLIAALKSIGDFTKRRLEINPTSGKIDVGFWLADEKVSLSFQSSLSENSTLFLYEKGKIVSYQSFVNIDGRNIEINKRIQSNDQTEKIWTDGFSNAILSKETNKGKRIFHFYSRFNPLWNQLVWSENIVKALMPIVIYDAKSADFGFEDNPADQRRLAANQNQTIHINKLESLVNITNNEPLSFILWIAALIILIIERILSLRTKTNKYVKG